MEWPSQEEPGSGLTASAPVSEASAPACTNGVWPPLRPVSVAQKNKPSTTLSSNVQSIDLHMDCMAWRLWTMRQSNGCSTPALRSSAAKWLKELAQKMKKFCTSMHVDENNGCDVFCEDWFLIAAAWKTAVRPVLFSADYGATSSGASDSVAVWLIQKARLWALSKACQQPHKFKKE